MNEKSLNELLASALRSGELSSDLNDQFVDRILAEPTEISDASKERVKSRLKRRIQDAAIATASRIVQQPTSVPLGRYVEMVRERAGLDRNAIGTRLGKSLDFVERFERGHINPLQLSTAEFADVTELFQVKFSVLPAMIAASTATAGAKHGYRAVARSRGGITHDRRGEDVERALEAFARAVPNRAKAVTSTSDEIRTYLSKVETELRRRGRTDLFT